MPGLRALGLRGRLVLLVLAVFVPLLTFAVFGILNRFGERTRAELRSREELTWVFLRAFTNYLDSLWMAEYALGSAIAGQQLRPAGEEIERLLLEQLNDNPTVELLSWVDPDAVVRASTMAAALGLSVADRADIRVILEGADRYLSDVTTSRIMEGNTVLVHRAVRKDGRLLGIVSAKLKLDSLALVLPEGHSGPGMWGLADRQGVVAYHSTALFPGEEPGQPPDPDLLRRALDTGPIRFERYRSPIDGREYLGVITPMERHGWAVYTMVPRDAVLGPSMREAAAELGALVLAAALAAGLALMLAGQVLRPIRALQAAALALAAGDLRARARETGSDEVAVATQTFDHMADRIASLEAERESFFLTSNALLCTIGGSGTWERFNPAWEQALGYRPEELLAIDPRSLVHPDDLHRVQGQMQVNGSARSFEVRLRCKDGSCRWFSWSIVGLPARSVYYCVGLDMTGQKLQAEELVRRSRCQEAVAVLSQAALNGRDLPGLIERAVAAVSDVLGVEACGVLGAPSEDGNLPLEYGLGLSAETLGRFGGEDPVPSLPDYASRVSGPVLVPDAAAEERFAPEPLLSLGLASGLAVAVRGYDRPYGVFVAFTRQHRSFSSEEIWLVDTVANLLGTCLDRDRAESERLRLLWEEREARQQAQEAIRRTEESRALLAESEALLSGQKLVLELIATGAPLEAVESAIAAGIEERTKDCLCAIKLLHPSGVLRFSTAPSLPSAVVRALDMSPVGPLAGASGTAAYRKEPVIIADAATDSLSHPVMRAAFREHGLRACWAHPILAGNGEILGVLVCYFREQRMPTAFERKLVETFTRLAGIAIERSNAEEARNRKLQALVEHSAEGVVAVDEEGRVLVANSAALRLLRMQPFQGHPLLEEAGLPPALVQVLREAARTESTSPTQHTFSYGDLVLDAHVSPVVTGLGRRYGAIAMIQDVTASVQYLKLQQSFITNVSHELRAPLALVSAMAEALRDNMVPESTRTRYLNAIAAEAGRLRNLANDVLELSRLDAGVVELDQDEFDLQLVFESLEDSWQVRCQHADITLLIESTPLRVKADYDRVLQVLTNLVDNAVKFTPSGGLVRIFAAEEDGAVRISVADSGPGIPPDQMGRIWERFYMVDKARTRNKESGSGLGLAIARQLVERMGGEVGVESYPGKGAAFSFTLPAPPGTLH